MNVFIFYAQESFPLLMRALVPVAIGATAGGGLTLRWWLQLIAQDLSGHLAVAAGKSLVLPLSPEVDWEPWLRFIWHGYGAW